MSKILVTFFSATGRTKKLAEEISKEFNFDIYEIKPKEIYTDKDLNWMNPLSRSSKEHRNKDIMPEILEDIDIKNYDKVIICYPVWWYVAPNIINSFLKKHNFANKEILLFATSGGSEFGKVTQVLKEYVDDSCIIKEGAVNPSENQLKDIINNFI